MTASPSITNCLRRFFRADSTIQAVGPIVAAAGNQPHTVAVALDPQSKAVGPIRRSFATI
jgi:hypothetical protein